MKKINLLCVIALITNIVFSQEHELILQTDFAIRDFKIINDSAVYLKKRNIHFIDQDNSYFIGGYGLEMGFINNDSVIISASNERVRNVCSVRFYDTQKTEVTDSFFYIEGRIIDFLLIPSIDSFVLSLTNNKIIIVNYTERPKFYKTVEIDIASLSRKLNYYNGTLYYGTDRGNIYAYNLNDYTQELLHKGSDVITDFIINNNSIVYSTISGELNKVTMSSNKTQSLKINGSFVNLILELNNNKIICGDWSGEAYIVDLNKMIIEQIINAHDKCILKIQSANNNNFYSSSLDGTIKKWNLN